MSECMHAPGKLAECVASKHGRRLAFVAMDRLMCHAHAMGIYKMLFTRRWMYLTGDKTVADRHVLQPAF
jgi:hypothetical protein